MIVDTLSKTEDEGWPTPVCYFCFVELFDSDPLFKKVFTQLSFMGA
jgi:hypothetical protein